VPRLFFGAVPAGPWRLLVLVLGALAASRSWLLPWVIVLVAGVVGAG
jgi:hypothetical protein